MTAVVEADSLTKASVRSAATKLSFALNAGAIRGGPDRLEVLRGLPHPP